jgi:hypothetical protein
MPPGRLPLDQAPAPESDACLYLQDVVVGHHVAFCVPHDAAAIALPQEAQQDASHYFLRNRC